MLGEETRAITDKLLEAQCEQFESKNSRAPSHVGDSQYCEIYLQELHQDPTGKTRENPLSPPGGSGVIGGSQFEIDQNTQSS